MSSSFVTPWTVAPQAPLSMGFFRLKYWSGLSFPPPGELPYPGIEPASPVSPALQADSLPTEPPGKPSDLSHAYLSQMYHYHSIILRTKILYINPSEGRVNISSLFFPERKEAPAEPQSDRV